MKDKIPSFQRTGIKIGHIDTWPKDLPPLEEIALKVSYRGSGRHKKHPAPNNEWVPNYEAGVPKCARFREEHWPAIEDALRDAIRAGCVQFERGLPFPKRAWTFINDELHEARITNQETGEYHAFPYPDDTPLPRDPRNLLDVAPRVTIPVL